MKVTVPMFANRSLSVNKRLYLILLVGLLLRVFDMVNAVIIERDGIAYARMGENFARGAFREALSSVFSPFYPLVIALFHLLIPDIELAGRIVSLVFGVLLIYVCFLFLKRLLDDKKALVGAFFVAIHPYLVRYSAQVLSESLATFLFAATIYLFYKGWLERDVKAIGLSGFFLALTYLTRPEYLIFYVPLVLILVQQKRFRHIVPLVLSFVVFAFLYALYMRVETGMWMLTKKALLNPFVSLPVFFGNVPIVVVHLLEAFFPPFVILLFLGFKKMNASYRNLALSVVVFHVVSLAYISHSTKRYSVEFVPVLMPFAVQGLDVVREYCKKFRFRKTLYYAVWVLVIASSLFHGLAIMHRGKALHKEAGLFMRSFDKGSTIASTRPYVSFYAGGKWVHISVDSPDVSSPRDLLCSAMRKGAMYFVFDETMQQNSPVLGAYLSKLSMIKEIRQGNDFVAIYGLKGDDCVLERDIK